MCLSHFNHCKMTVSPLWDTATCTFLLKKNPAGSKCCISNRTLAQLSKISSSICHNHVCWYAFALKGVRIKQLPVLRLKSSYWGWYKLYECIYHLDEMNCIYLGRADLHVDVLICIFSTEWYCLLLMWFARVFYIPLSDYAFLPSISPHAGVDLCCDAAWST